jgi:hypothetical protein
MNRKETLRHGAPVPFEPARERVFFDELQQHYEQHVGDPYLVVQEEESDTVHIDIHLFPAERGRPFHIAATSGMSDRPMAAPTGSADRIELLVGLPPSWAIDDEQLRHDGVRWAVRMLRSLGRFPHKHDTWLGYGHDVANGAPYGKNTRLCAALIAPARKLVVPPLRIRADDDDDRDIRIHFLAVFLLHGDELSFKKQNDTASLLARFDERGVDEVINFGRRSVLVP